MGIERQAPVDTAALAVAATAALGVTVVGVRVSHGEVTLYRAPTPEEGGDAGIEIDDPRIAQLVADSPEPTLPPSLDERVRAAVGAELTRRGL